MQHCIASSAPPTEASDVYALGSLAYYLLCGRFAHVAPTQDEVMALQLDEMAPPIQDVVPRTIPSIASTAIDCALSRNPRRRPPLPSFIAALTPQPDSDWSKDTLTPIAMPTTVTASRAPMSRAHTVLNRLAL